MTRKEFLKSLTSIIKNNDHASDDARQIVMSILCITHSELLANDNVPISQKHRIQARQLANARSRNTPMAYLLKSRSFFGRQFLVNKHTLIPRPETELIVEEAISLSDSDTQFLDIGTGSGAIAITLNLETSMPVISTDTSKKALKIAKENAKKLKAKIEFHHGSLLDPIWPNELSQSKQLIIVANLPYLSIQMWETSPEEVRDHEPKKALVSDNNDGLDLYRQLLTQIKSRQRELPENFYILLEIDPRQENAIAQMVHEVIPKMNVQIKNDLAGNPRVVILSL